MKSCFVIQNHWFEMSLFGITLPAFRVAGGLLLFWIAFEMVFERRQERHENTAQRAITQDDIHGVSVFPLAIPLMAGPGAISATILLSGEFSSALDRMALIGIILAIVVLTYGVYLVAERVEGLLGATGRTVLTRLLGVILSALAVQFVADGVKALIADRRLSATRRDRRSISLPPKPCTLSCALTVTVETSREFGSPVATG
jgi:multiple antibiotic resistance protein